MIDLSSAVSKFLSEIEYDTWKDTAVSLTVQRREGGRLYLDRQCFQELEEAIDTQYAEERKEARIRRKAELEDEILELKEQLQSLENGLLEYKE